MPDTTQSTPVAKTNPAEVRAAIRTMARDAINQGLSAAHTNEALEATIVQEFVANRDNMPESTRMVLAGILICFEIRRLETPPQTAH